MSDERTQAAGGDSSANRRSSERSARDDILFLQLAAEQAGAPLRNLRCRAADVSAGGLRVRLDEPVVVGSRVELVIRLADAARNFYLLAEVRWCRPSADDNEIGLQVVDSLASDYVEWMENRGAFRT